MAKVAVIYIAQTKHVLACVTTAGDLDPKTKVTDLVDKGVLLRHSKGEGEVVFLPSANDALKLVSADVDGDALKELLATAANMSIPDEKSPMTSAGTTNITGTAPAASIQFSFTAPGKTLQCVLAHQRGPASSDNPATVITDVINPADTSKTINVDYRVGDFLALFVEGFLPVVQ
jgi:hypothetical protein